MDLDYRELNEQMAIFAGDPLVGSGLPLWLPAGAAVRDELQRLAKDLARADGCLDVYSPVLGKRTLFERSGHLTRFADDMFPAMSLGDDDVMLRPANCPHHALIYGTQAHSYRELPIRLNELAPMFRAERSGVLSGLSRVRQINLDDTHVFCSPDQIGAEAARGLRAALTAQQILGLPIDYVRLSLRDESEAWLGSIDAWKAAEEALRQAAAEVLVDHGLSMVEAVGEAAFYGPKLDLQIRDGRGQEETIATVQLDFNQPERFDLTFTASDGTRQRVVMIHRGTIGSMERVVASLLDRYQGRLPFWLAPTQVVVLPVGDQHDVAARGLVDGLIADGRRACLSTQGSLGARVRAARHRRDCVIAVVGDNEAQAATVQVTDVAASFNGTVQQAHLRDLLATAHRARTAIAW